MSAYSTHGTGCHSKSHWRVEAVQYYTLILHSYLCCNRKILGFNFVTRKNKERVSQFLLGHRGVGCLGVGASWALGERFAKDSFFGLEQQRQQRQDGSLRTLPLGWRGGRGSG